MAFCKNCGQQLNEGVSVCPNCGTAVENVFTQEAQSAVNEAASAATAAAGAAGAAGAAAAGAAQDAAQGAYNQAQQGFTQAQGAYNQAQQGFTQAQGGYQQAPYQQQAAPQAPAQKSIHPVAGGMWAYLFGWIGFIVVMAGADQSNPYVRFHTNQSLVLNLFGLISIIPILGYLWAIFMFVLWIFAIIGASKGEMKEVPLLGKIHILK